MKNKKITFTAIAMALACFALLPQLRAVSPPPDGCYPGFTTAEGCNALQNLTSGVGNTGVGWRSLFLNSTANFSTGVGAGTLVLNNGDSTTAIGAAALLLNTSGTENTAVGTAAMANNDTGGFNTGVGAFALTNNIDGFNNNAFGDYALGSNTSGARNNAVGTLSLLSLETGGSNNALGEGALQNNISGFYNTAVGDLALQNTTDSYNTALGAGAGTDPGIASNNVYIGDTGFGGDENVISIGGIPASGIEYENTYIGGIFGASVNVGTAVPVYVDTDGHLGTNRVNASGQKVRIRSPQGAKSQAKLNEFQKQQKRIADLEATVARLAATVKGQAAQIEKVSAHLELRKPARRVVTNKE